MPELPDLTIYVESLEQRLLGRELVRMGINNPFVLRTVAPAPEDFTGRELESVRRIGKRLALGFAGGLHAVMHLMVAGRLRWQPPGGKGAGKNDLCAFAFDTGTLVLAEAGSKRRASLHLVQGNDALAAMDPGGLEPLEVDEATFAARLRSENHTLKRALTDPRLFAGIGNAYSDEILHRAKLSPIAMTAALGAADVARLFSAAREVLAEWAARLREQAGGAFPEKVTAFRGEMAVHGRYGKPCPVCGAPVQRIVYAENETNYCARCQTGGKILADRALSRLLKKSWPRTLEELE